MTFTDNIWGAYLANMQLISKFNKGFRFLLYVTDIYSKYAWVITLRDKKGITITNAFLKILKRSNRKRNDIEILSTHNEEKSVVAERFIRTLKNNFFKYMTSISKNVYIDKLDDIVNKYNTYIPLHN